MIQLEDWWLIPHRSLTTIRNKTLEGKKKIFCNMRFFVTITFTLSSWYNHIAPEPKGELASTVINSRNPSSSLLAIDVGSKNSTRDT